MFSEKRAIMARCFSEKTSRLHLFLVASAILGMLISVFPNPVPSADRAKVASCECDSPSTSLPDDAEVVHSVDEANGLTSTSPNAHARLAIRPSSRALPVPSRPTRPWSRPGDVGLSLNLPILLCRLTC